MWGEYSLLGKDTAHHTTPRNFETICEKMIVKSENVFYEQECDLGNQFTVRQLKLQYHQPDELQVLEQPRIARSSLALGTGCSSILHHLINNNC